MSDSLTNTDEVLETIWLRALDMTSDDFDTDEKYEKAKANYFKHNKKLLEALISDTVAKAEREAYKKGYIDGGIGVINEQAK